MRFFDSTIAILTTQAVGLAAMFLVNLIISRAFGTEGKGAIALLMNTAEVMFAITNLALGTSAQYFISKRQLEPRQLSGNFCVFPLTLLVLIVAGIGVTWPLWRGLLPATLPGIAVPAILVTTGMLIYEPSTQLLIAVKRLGLRSIAVFVMNGLLLLTAAVAALMANKSIAVVNWGYVAAFLVTAITALALVTAATGVPRRPSASAFLRTMKYGGWIYLANVISHFAIRLDFFMVTAMSGIAAGGAYSVAMGLTSPLGIMMGSIIGAFYPHTSGETDEQSLLTTPIVFRQVLLLLVAVSVVVAALSGPVLSLFGAGFLAGQPAMLFLLLAADFRGASAVILSHLLGRGYPSIKTGTTILTLALIAAGCSILIPRLGMVGAALSAAGAYLVETIVLQTLYAGVGGGSIAELYRFHWSDFTAIARESRRYLLKLRENLRRDNS